MEECNKPAPVKTGEAISSNYEIAALPTVARNDISTFKFSGKLHITYYSF